MGLLAILIVGMAVPQIHKHFHFSFSFDFSFFYCILFTENIKLDIGNSLKYFKYFANKKRISTFIANLIYKQEKYMRNVKTHPQLLLFHFRNNIVLSNHVQFLQVNFIIENTTLDCHSELFARR